MSRIDFPIIELARAAHADPAQADNGAPEGEPEVWDSTIDAFNPHLSHSAEPPPIAVSPEFVGQTFDVEQYLAEERTKDLLRFSTAGSVDDGKSTLIGRLLYDTQSIYDDQLQSIEGKGTTAPGVLDLALLTDGLRAEREQGITIDVAYRYFSTAKRKFIIADTPGHEQYTRNMATGASTADVAIILVDARKGVLVQSRRHAFITALLGVRNIIVAINKMDLVGYSQDVFQRITAEFNSYFESQDVGNTATIRLHFVPVSALEGDNVVHTSTAMPWYAGPTLLDLLETLPSSRISADVPFRFAVQRVSRPNLDFRGYAGQIASGTVTVGDNISVMPAGKTSRVKEIVTFDGSLQSASAPLSVTLTLDDEVDISRGDVLSASASLPIIASSFEASLVWMDAAALDISRRYLLKHMSRGVQAFVRSVDAVVDLSTGKNSPAASSAALALNEIGRVQVEVMQPLPIDPYTENRHTGSFVLIDPDSNHTVAAGMILAANSAAKTSTNAGPVSLADRQARHRHMGARLALSGPSELGYALERALFERGAFLIVLEEGDTSSYAALVDIGALVLTSFASAAPSLRAISARGEVDLPLAEADIASTVALILTELRALGVLLAGFPQ